ncbi:1,2-phenylacetyl-CoA epoxidase subunit PaaC [Rhodothermus profundi]|uniref:Ring-1,2-phenylacetyl-CoA epoxidase subunit PaaC n=1 Tax=Rhodothermus profundi TaxID=633813 RepID=A0A1M6Q366_9BACT|nr:1,2-phenylacetyl-CoA epoxidase subunit PaaC [Rhodothermus profundi]SHK14613.1 ring-1,2-phenylacetyl-CoA epoxidase subunit PaaC [Rhodothermus profundi]
MTLETLDASLRPVLFEYLLRLGDDALILGHRLSEWCGHGPYLEEDIALANLALDCLGHAEALLTLAADVEGKGRTADDLAFLRDAYEFRNVQMVELPRGDFAFTIVRQFLFATYACLLYEALQQSSFEPLAGIAAKAYKEMRYHLRHSSEWVRCLGDGTEESHRRAQAALDDLWMYTGELFEVDDTHRALLDARIAPDLNALYPKWKEQVESVIQEATLTVPETPLYMATGGRRGHHTEHLGHLLAEMQFLQRAYPGAQW